MIHYSKNGLKALQVMQERFPDTWKVAVATAKNEITAWLRENKLPHTKENLYEAALNCMKAGSGESIAYALLAATYCINRQNWLLKIIHCCEVLMLRQRNNQLPVMLTLQHKIDRCYRELDSISLHRGKKIVQNEKFDITFLGRRGCI